MLISLQFCRKCLFDLPPLFIYILLLYPITTFQVIKQTFRLACWPMALLVSGLEVGGGSCMRATLINNKLSVIYIITICI